MKLNLFNKLAALIICSSILFTSCKNESEVMSPTRFIPPSNAEFKSQQEAALTSITQTKTFKAEDGIEFTSTKGAILKIEPGSLQTPSGTSVSGEVKLSFIEMYDRGHMIVTNKALMGKDSNGQLKPLITGGQFNIKITQGNNELKPSQYFSLNVPVRNTGEPSDEMILWEGTINSDGNLEWINTAEETSSIWVDTMSTNYEPIPYYFSWPSSFGWINCDYFAWINLQTRTDFEITVPNNFSNINANVYLTFENEPNILMQAYSNNQNKSFLARSIPVGFNANVVFISGDKNQVIYSIKKVKITPNATVSITESDLKTTSKENLIDLVNALN